MMRRRDLLILLPALAVPVRVATSQDAKRHKIIWMSTETRPDPFVDGFLDGMRERGYVVGRNLELDLRYAPGNPAGLDSLVSTLADLQPDLVVSSGPAIRAMRAAREIPVLFAISADPVELGIARSLSAPGGNFTGSTFMSMEVAAKRVQILKEAVPRLRRLAVLADTLHPGEQSEWRATREAAQVLGIEPIYCSFKRDAELDMGLAAVRDARADALLSFPDGVTMVHRAKVTGLPVRLGIPSMFGWSEYCDAGGLMSYGANQRATYFHLAEYADRLLRGAKPANLPIHQPTSFELVINLKTAREIGVTIPHSVLQRADRTIE